MNPEKDHFEENISRLVKLNGDPEQPSEAFTVAIINDALDELKHLSAVSKPSSKNGLAALNWDKAMSWAAMIAVVYGAGFGLLLRGMSWFNPVISVVVIITMFINWLTYFGRMIV